MSLNPDKFFESAFESAILNKIGPNIHYPRPIYNIGCPYKKIPGFQPLKQTFFMVNNCKEKACLTNHCFEYGNAKFPPYCKCYQKYSCKEGCSSCKEGCSRSSNCSLTCGTCNHNSNVIFY